MSSSRNILKASGCLYVLPLLAVCTSCSNKNYYEYPDAPPYYSNEQLLSQKGGREHDYFMSLNNRVTNEVVYDQAKRKRLTEMEQLIKAHPEKSTAIEHNISAEVATMKADREKRINERKDYLEQFYVALMGGNKNALKKYQRHCSDLIQEQMKKRTKHNSKEEAWKIFGYLSATAMVRPSISHITIAQLKTYPERYASFMTNFKIWTSKYPYAALDGKWYNVSFGKDEYVIVKVSGEGRSCMLTGIINPKMDLRIGTGW